MPWKRPGCRARSPATTTTERGISLAARRTAIVPAPSLTPLTLMATSATRGSATQSARPEPSLAAGTRYPKACANPAESAPRLQTTWFFLKFVPVIEYSGNGFLDCLVLFFCCVLYFFDCVSQ